MKGACNMCNKKKRTSLNLKKIGRRFLVGLLAMAMTSTMVPALQGMAQSVDAAVVAQEEYDLGCCWKRFQQEF